MKLWKKGLAALTAGLLCLGSVGLSGVELPASADVPYFYDGTYGDLYYDVIDAVEIRITGCEKEVTAVEIPAKIAGKPVTSVGRSAFSGCNSLAAVTIPDSVTRIGLDAFYKCSSLTTITMPDGVTILGANAFSFCTSLTEVTMPNSLTSIGSNAFSGCSSLTEIEIPDSVTSIGESAFSDCKKLTSITIPDSVTSIEKSAFSGCNNLTIYGYARSYAQKYAAENNIRFALIGGLPRGDVDGSGGIDSTDIFYTMLYIANVAVGNDGGLTPEQIKEAGFDAYFVDHTLGLYPQSAAGVPFTAAYFQSKGDPITDLTEDMAAEQKARSTYDNILRVVTDPDVCEPIRFLRKREIVHFQRFGEALRGLQEKLDSRNFYAFNPSFDPQPAAVGNSR